MEQHESDHNHYGILKRITWSIKSYWDSVYEYLKFCSAFEGSYMKEGISHMHGKKFWETLAETKQRYERDINEKNDEKDLDNEKDMLNLIEEKIKRQQDSFEPFSLLIQYFENFALEPESINLFSFIKENPQRLDNLWWKEIKSINLNTDSWINFTFRGIIEMVKVDLI